MITTPHPTNGAAGLWDQRRIMDRGMREQGMLLAR